MEFTHRDDPARSARIEQTSEDPLTYVVHHTDEKGKARKKTFKGGYVHDKALRFVLNKEGYIVRAPQDSKILWMTKFLSPYTGESTHCVDGEGRIWADGCDGFLYKVERATCETEKVRFGKARQLVAGPAGEAISLSVNYEKKEDGFDVKIDIKSVDLDFKTREIVSFVTNSESSILNTISISGEGVLLGPHPEGAALYKLDGSVLQTFSVVALHKSPGAIARVASGAISKNGKWIAISENGSVRRLDVDANLWETYPAEFTQMARIQISDSGAVYVTGFQYPSHAMFRVDESGTEKISSCYRSTISSDGTRFVEVEYGRVSLRSLEKREENLHPNMLDGMELPDEIPKEWYEMKLFCEINAIELGMAKYGRAEFIDNENVVVLTDAYTLAEISFQSY